MTTTFVTTFETSKIVLSWHCPRETAFWGDFPFQNTRFGSMWLRNSIFGQFPTPKRKLYYDCGLASPSLTYTPHTLKVKVNFVSTKGLEWGCKSKLLPRFSLRTPQTSTNWAPLLLALLIAIFEMMSACAWPPRKGSLILFSSMHSPQR